MGVEIPYRNGREQKKMLIGNRLQVNAGKFKIPELKNHIISCLTFRPSQLFSLQALQLFAF
jgi:hypothetical protein